MIKKLKYVAIAAASCALMPLGAQAAAFNGGSELTFVFSETIAGLQSPTTFSFAATGNATAIADPASGIVGAVLIPGTALDVTGTNLNTWAGTGSGFSVLAYDATGASAGRLDFTNFAYATAAKQMTFSMSINGGAAQPGSMVVFPGTLFSAAGKQQTTTPFVGGANPTGEFSATRLRLSSASATALATALGSPGSASTLSGTDFGEIRIQAVTAVPEPSSYALMGLGLAVAATVARRRSAK